MASVPVAMRNGNDVSNDKFEPRHELRTPLEITNDMDRALFFARKGTKVLHELREVCVKAKTEFMRSSGERMVELKKEFPKMSKDDREIQARVENWELYDAMCERQAEFDFAKDKLEDLQRELSKSQSEARLVIKEMEMSR